MITYIERERETLRTLPSWNSANLRTHRLRMPVRWSNAYRTARRTRPSRRMARVDVMVDRRRRRGLKMGYSSMLVDQGWRVKAADMVTT